MADTLTRVACVGECMIELHEAGPGVLRRGFGGDTLNTAVYLARGLGGRGARVEYVTALGDDPFSDAMIEAWHGHGVGTELVRRLPGRLPGLYLIQTDGAGERRFYYWRREAPARELFDHPDAGDLAAALAGFDLVYLSGITLAILGEKGRVALVDALRDVRAKGGRVAFDPNHRPGLWPGAEAERRWQAQVLTLATHALVSFDDERRLHGDADPSATARRLRGAGVGEVVVRDGPSPCVVAEGDRTVEVEAPPVGTVVDTTAAGDAFNAAYLAARIGGASPEAAAAEGHRLAAHVIGHKGAVVPEAG